MSSESYRKSLLEDRSEKGVSFEDDEVEPSLRRLVALFCCCTSTPNCCHLSVDTETCTTEPDAAFGDESSVSVDLSSGGGVTLGPAPIPPGKH